MGRDGSSSIEVSPIGKRLSSNLDNTTTNGLPCVCGKAVLVGPTITRLPEPSRGDSEQVTGGASSKSIGDMRVTPGVGGLRLPSRGRAHSLPLVHRDDHIRV